MSRKLHQTLRAFLPATGPSVLTGIALGLLVLGLLLSTLYAATSFSTFAERVEGGGSMLSVIFLPLVAILIEIAGLWEKSKPAKALLGLLALVLLIVNGIVASIAFGKSTEIDNSLEAFAAVSIICGPIIILAAILPIYGLIKTPAALQEIHQRHLEKDAVDTIQRLGGEGTYQQLAQALNIPEERIDPLLRKIMKDDKVTGFRNVKYRRFYTTEAYLNRQLTLLSIIKSRGAVSLQTLREEFDVPQGLVEEWINSLVMKEMFTGYLDWHKEIIYSSEAKHLRSLGQCPHCGAKMTLAGKGTSRCKHCGTEIFLPSAGTM